MTHVQSQSASPGLIHYFRVIKLKLSTALVPFAVTHYLTNIKACCMHNWIVYHTYPQEAVILGLEIANRRANSSEAQ